MGSLRPFQNSLVRFRRPYFRLWHQPHRRVGRAEVELRELEESMEVKWFEAYRTGGVDADTDEAAEYSRERDAYYAEWRRHHSRRQEIQDVPVLVVIDEAFACHLNHRTGHLQVIGVFARRP